MDLNVGRRIPDLVEDAKGLDKPAEHLAGAVTAAIPAGPVKDLLSGTFLGHPLHPLLTDLPIGFWTSAWVLDLVGGKRGRRAAQQLVGLGVLSALPTAAAGLSDWSDTTGAPRRVGLVHAAANSTALLSYALSWRARRKGSYWAGVAWGMVGAAAATAGGALGGHLSFALGVGVDNTAFDDSPTEWTAPDDDVLVHRDETTGEVHAIANTCTHRGGPLREGEITGGCVTCPWHGSRFRLDDGEIERGPATRPQPVYETRTTADRIEVRRRN